MQYYTDPASSYTFRTLKSALSFLETGKVSRRAFIQRTSVHDLYSFEISADMVIVFLFFYLVKICLTYFFLVACILDIIMQKSKVVIFVFLFCFLTSKWFRICISFCYLFPSLFYHYHQQ